MRVPVNGHAVDPLAAFSEQCRAKLQSLSDS